MRHEVMRFWDAVASAGPYANNLHLAPDSHINTSSLKFLQAECSSWFPINSVKALKAIKSTEGNKAI